MSFRDWQVGMKVTPLNDDPWDQDYDDEVFPEFGVVYTIRSIGIGYDGNVYITLVEIVNPQRHYELGGYGEIDFRASEFRKVEPRKTDISVFTRFLLNPNAPVREDA